MRVVIQSTAERVAAAVAQFIATALQATPDLVLGLPTGRTPIPLYRALVRLHEAGEADFSRAATFNLDEFVGLSADHAGSYHAFMRTHLFDRVNLRPERRHVLDGTARNWRAEAAAYERRMAELGGLDLAIVGVGRNGHVGFNEPARTLVARTHRVKLERSTRRANAHLFGGRTSRVPSHALSMGIGTIFGARGVILLATGRDKATIVRRALAGPVTTSVPASLLQTHPNGLAVLDRAAAARLPDSTGAVRLPATRR
jgi:glucosamine-6-phosphate deaminase